MISLIESYCVSSLLYCAESFSWSKSMLSSCENAFALAFMKVFKTFDKKIVENCQYYMGQLPIELKIINKQLNFLVNLDKSTNNICKFLNKENVNLCNNYKLSPIGCKFSKLYVKNELWSYFANKIGI